MKYDAEQAYKASVRQSFGRAAACYDQTAELQRMVGEDLCGMVPVAGRFSRVLDLGCGTGRALAPLENRCGQVVGLDLAMEMLQTFRRADGRVLLVNADAEYLPLAGQSFDLIVSNLSLQWCQDPLRLFTDCFRVLDKGGRLAFSTFGPASLHELRQAWKTVDGNAHVNEFQPADSLESAMSAAGFAKVSLSGKIYRRRHPTVLDLMRELKAIGAQTLRQGRANHLTGKQALGRMVEAYPKSGDGSAIEASYEIVFGMACRA